MMRLDNLAVSKGTIDDKPFAECAYTGKNIRLYDVLQGNIAAILVRNKEPLDHFAGRYCSHRDLNDIKRNRDDTDYILGSQVMWDLRAVVGKSRMDTFMAFAFNSALPADLVNGRYVNLDSRRVYTTPHSVVGSMRLYVLKGAGADLTPWGWWFPQHEGRYNFPYSVITEDRIVADEGDNVYTFRESHTGGYAIITGHTTRSEQMRDYLVWEGVILSRAAYTSMYFTCRCGSIERRRLMRQAMCNECAEAAERDRLSVNIQSYSHKPDPIPFIAGDDKAMLFGIEYETEQRSSASDLVKGLKYFKEALGPLVYFKRDGSLHSGVEVVTHPMNREFINSTFKPAMADVVGKLKKLKFQGEVQGSTHCVGMHIHISKKPLTAEQIIGMHQVLYQDLEFSLWLSSRVAREAFSQYTPIGLDVEQIRHRSIYKAGGHRGAINMPSYSETLELRLWSAQVDELITLKNIDATFALIDYTAKTAQLKRPASPKGFLRYLRDCQEYPALEEWVKKNPPPKAASLQPKFQQTLLF